MQQSEGILQRTKAARHSYQQACTRAEQLHQLWMSGRQDLQRYSALARMEARLASMPVIEQAKGILMAQCGWTSAEAFDALRRVSQRSNVRVRDLAAQIVAVTARSSARAHKPTERELARSASRLMRARPPKDRAPLVG